MTTASPTASPAALASYEAQMEQANSNTEAFFRECEEEYRQILAAELSVGASTAARGI